MQYYIGVMLKDKIRNEDLWNKANITQELISWNGNVAKIRHRLIEWPQKTDVAEEDNQRAGKMTKKELLIDYKKRKTNRENLYPSMDLEGATDGRLELCI